VQWVSVLQVAPLFATFDPITYIVAPIIATVVGGGIVAVIASFTGRRRDNAKEVKDAAAVADKEKKAADLSQAQKIDKMYTLLQGDGFDDGLVKVVRSLQTDMAAVKFTLTTNGFKQPGGKDTILDILQQTRHNTKPEGGETQPNKKDDGTYDHS
jgi:hypothetical protein